jgi:hypothetical protein
MKLPWLEGSAAQIQPPRVSFSVSHFAAQMQATRSAVCPSAARQEVRMFPTGRQDC